MPESDPGKRYVEELTVGFPRVLHDRFEQLCDEKGFRKDEVVRTLVDDFVEKYTPDDQNTHDPAQIDAFTVDS